MIDDCKGGCMPRPPIREPWELDKIISDSLVFGEARVRFDPPVPKSSKIEPNTYAYFSGPSLFQEEFLASAHITDRAKRVRYMDWEARLTWMAAGR